MSLYKDASLVMIPSAYKDGKLYSIRPTDGSGDFTFSRGSNLAATRVDVNGLIEKGRENLATYSNDFSNAVWSKANVSATSGQSGYDGSTDAWKIEGTGSSVFSYLQQLDSTTPVKTKSVYAKAGSVDWVSIWSGGSNKAYFDLANGTKGTLSGSHIIDSSITSVGGGWYRCEVAMTGSATSFYIIPANADNSTSLSSGEYIYIQDAQLEQGLVATDYIETGTSAAQSGILEDMPRLDYSGSCPSLLLEPQRTNKLVHSEYFDSWTQNAVDLDFGYLAPDGTYSAYKVTDNTGQNNASLYIGGILYNDTRSIWARTTSGTGSVDLMTYFENTNNTFNITEEWQRFDVSSVTTSVGSTNFYAVDFRGGGLNEVILWGAQAEVGSYPTSYIPTYGTSQTRSKESFNMNLQSQGIFESSDTQGVLMIEYEKPNTGENVDLVRFMGAGANGRGFIYNSGVNFASDWAGGVSGVIDHDGNNKTIWRLNTLSAGNMFHNGSKLGGEATGTAWSDIRLLRFNMEGSGGVLRIKQILLFPTALTDSECIALTTL